MHRGDADPGPDRDSGPKQHCRGTCTASENPSPGGHEPDDNTSDRNHPGDNPHGRAHGPARDLSHPRTNSSPGTAWSADPFRIEYSGSLQFGLSEAELSCIGESPEELAFALRGPGPESPEEQARLLNCLHDETLYRLFLAGFVPGPEPLSVEASDCVRAAFDVINPRSVMMAGIKGDPGFAMAGSMVAFTVATACLTDKEWDLAAQVTGL